jgi:micrococcal nuclease
MVIQLSCCRQIIRILLYASPKIYCPEKSQAFGQAAKQFTSNLCFGKTVKLIGNQHDRYGRTVAQIELEDGINVNYEIVKNSYAWQYLPIRTIWN